MSDKWIQISLPFPFQRMHPSAHVIPLLLNKRLRVNTYARHQTVLCDVGHDYNTLNDGLESFRLELAIGAFKTARSDYPKRSVRKGITEVQVPPELEPVSIFIGIRIWSRLLA